MIENVVKVLNELLEADTDAINQFFRQRTVVNKSICDHSTIQVSPAKQRGEGKIQYGILRPLGLINGLLLGKEDKVVVMIMDEFETNIIKFSIGIISEDGIVREDK